MEIKSKNIPDYRSYHLHELEEALRGIDEDSNPDEANLIRDYIAQGGYVYPPETRIERVEFTHAGYKWLLVLILSLLLTMNSFIFAVSANFLSMIPMVIQGIILLAISINHKYARVLIKLWCALMILSSMAGFMSMHYAPEFNGADFIENSVTLLIGVAFLVLADKHVQLVPVQHDSVSQ